MENRSGKRVQITVPFPIAAEWDRLASESKMSVSAWVTAQVQRSGSLADMVMSRFDSMTEELIRLQSLRERSGVLLTDEEAFMVETLQVEIGIKGQPCTFNDAIRTAVRIADAQMDPPDVLPEVFGELSGGAADMPGDSASNTRPVR